MQLRPLVTLALVLSTLPVATAMPMGGGVGGSGEDWLDACVRINSPPALPDIGDGPCGPSLSVKYQDGVLEVCVGSHCQRYVLH